MYNTLPKFPYSSPQIHPWFSLFNEREFIHQPSVMLIMSSHSLWTETLEINVCSCLVNRWVSCCIFTEQIVLILSSVRNRTSTTTYTMLLCFHIYSKQFVSSSQAAAMEASSSCRPWGWGERKKNMLPLEYLHSLIKMAATSVEYAFLWLLTLTKMRWGRKRLRVWVLVVGQRGRLMLSCGSVW